MRLLLASPRSPRCYFANSILYLTLFPFPLSRHYLSHPQLYQLSFVLFHLFLPLYSFLLLRSYSTTFIMCSHTLNEKQSNIAGHQPPSSCEQTSPIFSHSLAPHLPVPSISAANSKKTTVSCTKLDTVSKVMLRNVSLTVSLSSIDYIWYHPCSKSAGYYW